jgi:hypothetical protein
MGTSEKYVKAITSLSDETLKYLIQLNIKYGQKQLMENNGQLILNNRLLRFLYINGNMLNTKYEMRSLINLFNVNVYGENDRYLKFDMSDIKLNKEVKKLFNYHLRMDKDNNIRKDSKKRYCEFLELFYKEYKE